MPVMPRMDASLQTGVADSAGTCHAMRPGRLKQCDATSDCPATGVPHTQPGSGGVAVRSAPMDGTEGARRMLPVAHALAVPSAGIDGADRSVRPEAALPTALFGRARLLARLLAQARVAAQKDPPTGAASTLRRRRPSEGQTGRPSHVGQRCLSKA